MDGVILEGYGVENLDDLGHVDGHAGFPAFLDGGGIVLRGRREEIAAGVPQFLGEGDTLFHQGGHFRHVVVLCFQAVLFHLLLKIGGHLLVVEHLEVFVLEPFGFVEVEFGAVLADMLDVEELD